ISVSTPASSSATPISACAAVGAATTAASTRLTSSRKSVNASQPYCRATLAARAASKSTTATSSAASISARLRTCFCPKVPAPTTAIRVFRISLLKPPSRHAFAVRFAQQLVTINQQGLVSLDGERARVGANHLANRRRPDDRHVEAHVLLGLGALHNRQP